MNYLYIPLMLLALLGSFIINYLLMLKYFSIANCDISIIKYTPCTLPDLNLPLAKIFHCIVPPINEIIMFLALYILRSQHLPIWVLPAIIVLPYYIAVNDSATSAMIRCCDDFIVSTDMKTYKKLCIVQICSRICIAVRLVIWCSFFLCVY